MSGRKILPELLAPAGSYDALVAAVAAGADAVYFGGTRFGARRFAENFDEQEIARAIDYAHLHGVKAYITVNTLVHDRETPRSRLSPPPALRERGRCDTCTGHRGRLARPRGRPRPSAPCVHPDDHLFGRGSRLGCEAGLLEGGPRKRAARSRGSGISRRVTGGSGVGLEIFVHGALCYCYSGQCLLSSVMGGRSGNRGTCAQPCRKPYTLVSGTTDRMVVPGGRRGSGHEVPTCSRQKTLHSTRGSPRSWNSPWRRSRSRDACAPRSTSHSSPRYTGTRSTRLRKGTGPPPNRTSTILRSPSTGGSPPAVLVESGIRA